MPKGDKAGKPEADNPENEAASEEDELTSSAVDDIEKHEGDDSLKSDDAEAEIAEAFEAKPQSFSQKVAHAVSGWWGNKKARYATLVGLVVVFVGLAAMPTVRYGVLNAAGVRANMSLMVLDKTTQLPLKDAMITVEGKTSQTNTNGKATFGHLSLGNQTVTISKTAFANVTEHVVLTLGNNTLDDVSLKAVGTQYSFVVTDYITGKPVANAAASSGGSDAQADTQGKIILTVNPTHDQTIPVTISSSGYRDEKVNVTLGSKAVTVILLVPAGKDVFISQASGKYDLYKSDLDGKNRALLLAASGLENSNITLVPSPDHKKVMLISKRDNIHDADGYLLYTLVIVDIDSGSSITLDHGESIQAVGWNGNRFIYQETFASASAANAQRSRIVSYNYPNNTRIQLANADQFNTVLEAQGSIYYAISSSDPGIPAAFYKVNADGTNRQQILKQEVWTALRRDYNTLALQTAGGWYSYGIGGKQPKQSTAPSDFRSISFSDSSDGSQSLWNDNRDGKGVMVLHDVSSSNDTVIATQVGLATPFVWAGDGVVIYRVSSPQETADYVISAKGGLVHKITDVTNTFGAL